MLELEEDSPCAFGLHAHNGRVNTCSSVPFQPIPALYGLWSIPHAQSPRSEGIFVILILHFHKNDPVLSSKKLYQ